MSQFAVMCQPCENDNHPWCLNPKRCECGCRGGCGHCSDCDEGIFECRKKPKKSEGASK